MAKRALLVGCNYPGTEHALNGCINDVYSMKALLTEFYGYDEDTITMQIDTDPTFDQPTGANIKSKLRELVDASEPGDVLFFHFSGHGTQLPGSSAEEQDMKDEAICPTDMNVILDDDLRAIIGGLQDGVFFTMVSDCCHSGGMLDHAGVQISGPKDGQAPAPDLDLGSFLNALGMKRNAKVTIGEKGYKNRSLPTNDLMQILSQKLGQNINLEDLRASLGTLFGAEASAKIQGYLKIAEQLMSAVGNNGGGGAPGQGGGSAGCLTAIMAVIMKLLGGGGGAGGSQGPNLPLQLPQPGAKPPSDEQLALDKGVLITGCQSHETSADACPSGNPKKAFGALSNAINTVVRSHAKANPDTPLPYRTLVYSVRELLSKGGFTQNPCLEGSAINADAGFVTGQTVATA